MLFQQLALWPHLTLKENILFPFVGRQNFEARQQSALEFAQQLKLEQALDTTAVRASGGERQRAALIRLLTLDPEILLLDEPTSHLDATLTKQVIQIILAQKKRRKGLIIVSHMGAFASAVCDNLLLLRLGQPPLRNEEAIREAELN
jgi:ABC-type polar amino acid transport system ATPase subunit